MLVNNPIVGERFGTLGGVYIFSLRAPQTLALPLQASAITTTFQLETE